MLAAVLAGSCVASVSLQDKRVGLLRPPTLARQSVNVFRILQGSMLVSQHRLAGWLACRLDNLQQSEGLPGNFERDDLHTNIRETESSASSRKPGITSPWEVPWFVLRNLPFCCVTDPRRGLSR